MSENLKNQEKAVVEAEIKDVETAEDQANQSVQADMNAVVVKPNLIDKQYQKYMDRRMKKAQAKADKQAKKAAADAEPKKDLKGKIIKGAGIAAVVIGGVAGAVLFGGKGNSEQPVELGDGEITVNPALEESECGSSVETIDSSETAVPMTDEA